MAHFARLDGNNIVTQVIVVNNSDLLDVHGVEDENLGVAFCQSLFGVNTRWVQTSYNGSIRKNYSGVGYAYDAGRNAFIPPKPYPSWILDDSTCRWAAPVAYPQGGGAYTWNEPSQTWIRIN